MKNLVYATHTILLTRDAGYVNDVESGTEISYSTTGINQVKDTCAFPIALMCESFEVR